MRSQLSTPYAAAATTWLPYAERHWHQSLDRPDCGYFGTGTVAIQSLEAALEHAFVCATLARRSDYDVKSGGLSPEALVERARAGLRYLTETHVTGSMECVPGTDDGGTPRRGGRWGGGGWSPVSAFFLWLVADALGEGLSPADAAAVQRVLVHEADANLADQRCTVLAHHGYFHELPPIPTGRFGTSWPESNNPEPSLQAEVSGLDGQRYRITADWIARTVRVDVI